MHEQVTAEPYDACSKEQCVGIEIVDGMVVVSPGASKRHNQLIKILVVALEAAAGAGTRTSTSTCGFRMCP